MDDSLATVFSLASRFLVDAVRLVPEKNWDSPGLGSWNLRELVAHANRGQTTVEEYLLRPQPPAPRGSGYFSEESIAERGREAVLALGEDPAASVAAASDAVISLVEQASPDATIGSPAGTTTLEAYLPSRIAEVTIHGLDIVRALGAALVVPPPALKESLAFVAQRSLHKGNGEIVLFALTGRGQLPAAYAVY